MKDLVLNENFEKRGRQQEYVNIWKYLLWTFLIAWIMQTAVAILYYNETINQDKELKKISDYDIIIIK